MEGRLWCSFVLVVCAAMAPGPAWGQASPQAEALFREGKQLMKDGKVADACAAFEGSERAEHNIATLLSAADCREKNHQFATAWAQFLQAESQTRQDPSKQALNTTAKQRANALEPKLSYLTIEVPDAIKVPELAVMRDGNVVDPAEWNRAIPVDGGAHLITAKAPGYEPWSSSITVGETTDKQALKVGKLKALPKPKTKPGMTEPSMLTDRRKIAIGIAAGGLVAAGVGIGFGLDARSLRDQALATCPTAACTLQGAADAQSANDRARKRALIANIGFGVAGAAVIGAGVLWVLSPPVAEKPTKEKRIAIVPSTNGFVVTGSF